MRRTKSPLVLVLPLGRGPSQRTGASARTPRGAAPPHPSEEVASDLDAALGATLARSLGKRLELTGRRVVAAEVAARLVRAVGVSAGAGPLAEPDREVVLAHTSATFVVHGTFQRAKGALSLDLWVTTPKGKGEAAHASGPDGQFQDVLDDAASRVAMAIPGGAIDAEARRLMKPARGTSSLDAFLALVRARAAWAKDEPDAFEEEVAAAQRLDPSWPEPWEVVAGCARATGDVERATKAMRDVTRLHREAGRAHEHAEALNYLGDALVRQGDWSDGLAAYEEAAKIFDGLGEVRGAVQARTNVASVLLRRGEHKKAIAEYTAGLERFADYPEDRAKHVFNLGLALKQTGDLPGAAVRLEEARELGVQLRDDALIAACYNALGAVHDRLGDPERALQQFRRAEEHLDAESDPVLLAGVKDHIGIILKKKGQLHEALDYSEQACVLLERRGDPMHLAIAYVNRAVLLLDLERDDEATPFVVAAHREFVRLGSPSTETTERMLRELGLDDATIAAIPEHDDGDLLPSLVRDELDDDDDDDDDDDELDDGSDDEVEELEDSDEALTDEAPGGDEVDDILDVGTEDELELADDAELASGSGSTDGVGGVDDSQDDDDDDGKPGF